MEFKIKSIEEENMKLTRFHCIFLMKFLNKYLKQWI